MVRCGYEFDRDQWDPPVGDADKALPKHWKCPHEAVENGDYCHFHVRSVESTLKEDLTDEEIRTAFSQALAGQEPETNEFIGATLPGLGIQGQRIDAVGGLDLRGVTVTQDLVFDDAVITGSIDFGGSRFEGRCELDDAKFESSVSFWGCEFDGVVRGRGTVFEDDVVYSRSEFSYTLEFSTNTTFESDAVFTHATFESVADFHNATFQGQAFFRDVTFDGRTEFVRAEFYDDARFADAVFSGSLRTKYARFEGVLQFGDRGINRAYGAATFRCPFVLEDVKCSGGVYLIGCNLEGGVRITDCTFESIIDFSETTIRGDVEFLESECSTFEFAPDETNGNVILVEIVGSTVHGGKIYNPRVLGVYFHLEEAEIGDVVFHSDGSEPSGSSDLEDLSSVRFVDTVFDGFDFTSYRPSLEPDWSIHQFDGSTPFEPLDLDGRMTELTYMRAKSGADAIGDNRAASGFFIREMKGRGQRHYEKSRKEDTVLGRVRAICRYVVNVGFRYSSNYAESPWRVLGGATILILLFASAYFAGYGLLGLTAPYPDAPFAGFVILSLESFVTLVHSPGATIDSWLIRMMTALEGFLGAFVIALFLFTLTRAVHR